MKHWAALVCLACATTSSSAARSSGLGVPPRQTAPSEAQALAGPPPEHPPAAPRPMPTVQHRKLPGRGYGQGSPLYGRQQWAPEREEPLERGAGAAALDDEGAVETVWACWGRHPLAILLSNSVYVVLVLSAGCIYRKSKEHAIVEPPWAVGGGASPAGIFSRKVGDQRVGIYLVSLFCPVVRWAATMSDRTVNLLDFWVALAGMLGLSVLSLCFWLTPSLLVLWGSPPSFVAVLIAVAALCIAQSMGAWATLLVALALFGHLGPLAFAGAGSLLGICVAVGVVYRQRLRRALGHSPAKRKILNLDVIAWCCCLCCVLSQEAREVERATPEGPPLGGGAWAPQAAHH
mmetsp:Transcript_102809/g.320323  ORF Transcript_102809/g.320323 Transcript_102809/m.320323 type:complete len:347 (-) Transcript_102809:10-1050(-)